MTTTTDRVYPVAAMATLDAISGAAGLLRREWGDYGYRMSIEGRNLFGVRHSDGSEFFIRSDNYGNAAQVEWNGTEWIEV